MQSVPITIKVVSSNLDQDEVYNMMTHAADMLIRRSTDILHQVKVQLMLKSVNRSFPLTKQTLDQTLDQLTAVTLKDVIK
jgi:hypothetical protein